MCNLSYSRNSRSSSSTGRANRCCCWRELLPVAWWCLVWLIQLAMAAEAASMMMMATVAAASTASMPAISSNNNGPTATLPATEGPAPVHKQQQQRLTGSGGSTGGFGGQKEKVGRSHHYGVSPQSSSKSSYGTGAAGGGGQSMGVDPSSTGLSAATGAGSGSDKPFFDDVSPRNVTTIVDDMAVLKCRVKHKGDRTVSWMRKRDLHILTSDIFTYTGDQRFSVIHPPDSDDWDLKIEYAQQRDSGIYECQVNTEPKINLAVNLDVSAARAKIIGSQEVHVKKGSTISLSCVVNVHASSISWYHGSSVVDFDSARGGISLETEKTDGGTSSRLMLTRATLRDSGNYTCVPSGAVSASVQVHVLNGEHPAAMQTSGSRTPDLRLRHLMLFVVLLGSQLNSYNLSKLIHFISTLLFRCASRFQTVTRKSPSLGRGRHLIHCHHPGVWFDSVPPEKDENPANRNSDSYDDIRSSTSCHPEAMAISCPSKR
ncbi:uncharacterized protein LOC129751430 isoform X2 [Uranotaenia lowii]|uniref:uncharacterized protein LOC129751430 isoform X2 n=1 Tax=Uranotaenia lowii TaxID=190385 RepID=UPI002478BE19|nr:uncharacterized protein LOC129751430 isoform X2 [Uranotaenia lowii]